jgi:hypothetical protein
VDITWGIKCLAHILNRSARDLIAPEPSAAEVKKLKAQGKTPEEIKELTQGEVVRLRHKIKDIITKLNSSDARWLKYVELCKAAGIKPYTQNHDMPTRWGSTATMLWKVLHAKDVIKQWWVLHDLPPEGMLSDVEWALTAAVLEIINIFKDITIEGQRESKPTLNWAVANFEQVFDELELLVFPAVLEKYRSVMLGKVSKYWDGTGDVYFAAMVLDPCEKLNGIVNAFRSRAEGVERTPPDQVKERVLSECSKVLAKLGLPRVPQVAAAPAPEEVTPAVEAQVALLNAGRDISAERRPSKRSRVAPRVYRMARVQMLQEHEGEDSGGLSEPIQSPLEAELELYLSESIVPMTTDILAWWKANQVRFPLLAACARHFLAIPSTSATCERLWSHGGQQMSKYRHRLDLDRARRELVLRSWMLSGF